MELVVGLSSLLRKDCEADERTIAAYMLMVSWKDETEHQMLDHYHWINNTGCLTVEEIQAIARKVW